MTDIMMQVRARVYDYMAAAGMVLQPPVSDEVVRSTRQVAGTAMDGTSASFSDADGVIEFGLLSRVDGEPTNVLHASVNVEDARIYCVSETKSDLNFEGPVTAEASADGLFLAADFFAEIVGVTATA